VNSGSIQDHHDKKESHWKNNTILGRAKVPAWRGKRNILAKIGGVDRGPRTKGGRRLCQP